VYSSAIDSEETLILDKTSERVRKPMNRSTDVDTDSGGGHFEKCL